jgi:hypothetical protein
MRRMGDVSTEFAMSPRGHEPKVSLGANLVGATSDSRHRLQARGFLSRAMSGLCTAELFTEALRGIHYHSQYFFRFGEHRNVTTL